MESVKWRKIKYVRGRRPKGPKVSNDHSFLIITCKNENSEMCRGSQEDVCKHVTN